MYVVCCSIIYIWKLKSNRIELTTLANPRVVCAEVVVTAAVPGDEAVSRLLDHGGWAVEVRRVRARLLAFVRRVPLAHFLDDLATQDHGVRNVNEAPAWSGSIHYKHTFQMDYVIWGVLLRFEIAASGGAWHGQIISEYSGPDRGIHLGVGCICGICDVTHRRCETFRELGMCS